MGADASHCDALMTHLAAPRSDVMAGMYKQVTTLQIKLFRQHFTGVPDLYGARE